MSAHVDLPFVPFVKEGTWNISLTYRHFVQIYIRDIGMNWIVEATYVSPCMDDNKTIKKTYRYGSVSFEDICLDSIKTLLED
ncbi:MAG: hypothetical protein GWN13_12625 [Phycisphaerae bacterium]|nr:hypothetical protein [Phycisphaerae bacterium]